MDARKKKLYKKYFAMTDTERQIEEQRLIIEQVVLKDLSSRLSAAMVLKHYHQQHLANCCNDIGRLEKEAESRCKQPLPLQRFEAGKPKPITRGEYE